MSIIMISIFSHTSASYSEALFSILGKGKRHATLIYKEWFKTGKVEGKDRAFINAQALYKEMMALTDFSLPPLLKTLNEEKTGKFLIGTADNFEIESVILPMKAGLTLCVSSQIGCKMGCAFCETAKMGLKRSLTPAEIVSQLFHARHTLKAPIRSVVFMGMGEPLDNLDAVLAAIGIFTDPHGFNLGQSHITVSTSGLVEEMERLIAKAPGVNLAVSVNAPTDAVRSKLMPVNQKHDMDALKKAMLSYCSKTGRKILVEYVLIEGKTDRLEDGTHLAHYLRGVKCTVNLIPYNPGRRGRFISPSMQSIEQFAAHLKALGYFATVRATKGQKIMAACGQLGNRPLA